MHNIRLAANRVGHNGWSKHDEQHRLKKERLSYSSWGTVDYELWVMFVNTPTGQANPRMSIQITVVVLVSIRAFQSVHGLEPRLVMMSHKQRLSSLPTKRSFSNCLALTGALALSTFVRLYTDVQLVEGPVLEHTLSYGAEILLP